MAAPGNHEADCEEIDFTTSLCKDHSCNVETPRSRLTFDITLGPEGQKNFTDFMNRFGRTSEYTVAYNTLRHELIVHNNFSAYHLSISVHKQASSEPFQEGRVTRQPALLVFFRLWNGSLRDVRYRDRFQECA